MADTADKKRAAESAAASRKAADAAADEHARLEERVFMSHPEIPHTETEPVEMSRRQLEVVYAPSGWVEVDEPGPVAITPEVAAEQAAAESATDTEKAKAAAQTAAAKARS